MLGQVLLLHIRCCCKFSWSVHSFGSYILFFCFVRIIQHFFVQFQHESTHKLCTNQIISLSFRMQLKWCNWKMAHTHTQIISVILIPDNPIGPPFNHSNKQSIHWKDTRKSFALTAMFIAFNQLVPSAPKKKYTTHTRQYTMLKKLGCSL